MPLHKLIPKGYLLVLFRSISVAVRLHTSLTIKRRRHHGQTHILPSICYSFVSLLLSFGVNAADLTVGYQTGIDPSKVPQADGLYEKAIGEKSPGAASIAGQRWSRPSLRVMYTSAISALARLRRRRRATCRLWRLSYRHRSTLLKPWWCATAVASTTPRPDRQNHRHPVRLHLPLQPARRAETLGAEHPASQSGEPATGRNRRCLETRRY